ncbi:alanine/glycine:cation symporter family protein [Rahnella woolbedingensis]|uniref:Alanine:cation symporter family protein n=1 Tax=Rahnella woolbedingensis TaxID=1510574 RepID=A0A419NA90_9GAMM|nr:alanine/glycine:cation symporter family protein [Rahnella woolbedingensis]RJT44838.1 alanine:cation symporter family protein [Rahnella woolbedingensis]
MNDLLDFFDTILWSTVLIYLLLGSGIYLTFRLGFIQFRRFGHLFSPSLFKRSADPRGTSPWRVLCLSLASRIGTGNLTGVTIAIVLGGPGAIFWIWIITVFSMATALIENTLAQIYKGTSARNKFRGGPADYMEKGLGMRWMGILFSFLMVISCGFIFSALQANSIAQASFHLLHVPALTTACILSTLVASLIFGGIRAVTWLSKWMIPLMAFSYLLLAVWVIGHHVEKLPQVFALIFKSAFGLQEAASGALAYGVTQGMQRGAFASEAGVGSSPNVAAMAAVSHPAASGFNQMLAVFIDTVVICTATALIILTSGVLDIPGESTGIRLLRLAIDPTIPGWSSFILAMLVFSFAFTSIAGNYVYAENNLSFVHSAAPAKLLIFRLLVIAMVFGGCLMQLQMLWKLADIFMALMAILNLTALLLLSGIAIKVVKDYERQRRMGKIPVFNPDHYPELRGQLEPGVWDKTSSPR